MRRKQINLNQKITLLFGLTTFFIVIGTIVQHLLLGTPFVMTRFALFIYPLFILTCCFLIFDVRAIVNRYVRIGLIILFPLMFSAHTVYSLNTDWYYEWRYMTVLNAKEMLAEINKDSPKDGQPVSLGSSWIFEPIFNFYRVTLPLDWLSEVDSRGIYSNNDYFFVTLNDLNSIPKEEVEVMQYYRETENYLARHTRNGDFISSVHLKAFNGKYVCADLSNNNLVVANRNTPDLWETFAVIKLTDSTWAISSFNFRFLSAELGHQNEITATREKIAEWEIFTMIELDSNRVAFKAANGKYLSVDEKTLQVFARADSIRKMEKFEIISR